MWQMHRGIMWFAGWQRRAWLVCDCLASFHRNRWVWVTGQVQDKDLVFFRVGFTAQTPIIMHSHALSLRSCKLSNESLGRWQGHHRSRTHPNHSLMGVSWQQEESIQIWLFALVLQNDIGQTWASWHRSHSIFTQRFLQFIYLFLMFLMFNCTL